MTRYNPTYGDASDALMNLLDDDRNASDEEASTNGSEVSADEDTPTTAEAVPEETRCKYPSKFCGRARARKTNGTFHRFCQYHRNKANFNQKRWTSVRRQQAALEEQQRRLQDMLALGLEHTPSPGMYTSGYGMPALLPDPVRLEHCPQPVELPLEDVHILNVLLVGEVSAKQAMLDVSNHHHPMSPMPLPLGWHTSGSLVEPDAQWCNI